MKTIKEISEKWVKNSLRAYLEGEKDLKWIQGILRGMSKNEVMGLLSSLQYGLPERRNELNQWLNT
ncbi:hypothetical protein A3B05_00020 [Candidatus Giovannonibacteria bacterium RIFCSPLOWO2_01_FULL_43_160]|uniref:Uncharacterized protein n=1 Tax=Candidatus Giovannonibacteria bacterium RIFCSPLOWO2_12_FULL_43_26 TaxID=1798363 RepID=A0A1F5XY07_9BACT|nr:MAG: hypothetical protein A2652_03440 [Candidatus Giovannonibacteria bacterium RIFCSPHIGHO2_01_FULL_43_140]OGF70500.1 MAG: hypothetical protein A3C76_00295 [Candidatus Giovannonibacteria bacterium RIFCSPHIGHO2_02_FULL_44_51]OGF72240.1 MAG: hypothetical protein A3E35_01585 [Candidatus Giovannonibacteria bacterium RIFCSPHIGHO2_12_FULL_44_22]OGF76136.1 MAG: hypothetical protein A3B05_00020 [Candidatus Giovannonibacteria bacterium RIFCSPLOWO2_01_FULL_43_160]OGF86119.1 MAG: hypothetical protein A